MVGRHCVKHYIYIVRRMCTLLSSVLPQQRFEMADQCYNSVTAQSFIWQTKDSTLLRHEGRWAPKEMLQPILAPCFIHFVSSPFTCPMQIRANQEGGVFVSLEVLTPGLQIFFCSIFMGFFPLSFSHHHFGLLFPILTTQCERVLLSRFKS